MQPLLLPQIIPKGSVCAPTVPLFCTSRPGVLRGNTLSSINDVRDGTELLPLSLSSKYR